MSDDHKACSGAKNGTVYVCPEKDTVCGTHPGRWCALCPLHRSPKHAMQLIENLVAEHGDEGSPAAVVAFWLLRGVMGIGRNQGQENRNE